MAKNNCFMPNHCGEDTYVTKHVLYMSHYRYTKCVRIIVVRVCKAFESTVSLKLVTVCLRPWPSDCLLVIFCNKMAVVPENRVLSFSVFKWSSYSSTYLPEWVVHMKTNTFYVFVSVVVLSFVATIHRNNLSLAYLTVSQLTHHRSLDS